MIIIPKETLLLLNAHCPPLGNKVKYDYGTAGFRYDHKLLPHIFVKMGILASLRSYSQQGKAVGLMCTASHNLENDNGIKMADPDGGMLNSMTWEKYAISLANAESVEEATLILNNIIQQMNLRPLSTKKGKIARMRVHFGRDTRDHSLFLISLAISAAKSLNFGENQHVDIVDHHIVTTPQLHFSVMHANASQLPNLIPFHFGTTGYFDIICHSYLTLLNTKQHSRSNVRNWKVDCACGVGGYQMKILQQKLDQIKFPNSANFEVINDVNDGPLNSGCGAEYVQKQKKPPNIYNQDNGKEIKIESCESKYNCSFDGDADRIVFHLNIDSPPTFQLLDGDKISVLVANFVLNELNTLKQYFGENNSDLTCGVVQTAYANGSSTDYLKNITKIDISIAKTGVKYVHAVAHKNYDIGIYFEANGHGTVLFGSQFYSLMNRYEEQLILNRSEIGRETSSTQQRALIAFQRLRALPSLVNQAVGDAISDLLLVDAILFLQDWNLEQWNSIYEDRPSRQIKVKIRDRNYITTNENETKVVSPIKLQRAIDQEINSLITKSANARCFVRPSGTEDAVRIYAEASSQKDADNLARKVGNLVLVHCDAGEGKDNMKEIRIKSRL